MFEKNSHTIKKRTWLRHAHPTDGLSTAGRRQEAHLLLMGAVLVQVVHEEHGVSEETQTEGRIRCSKLLCSKNMNLVSEKEKRKRK